MESIQSSVRRELVTLIPSAVLEDVVCFTFYDYHPSDTKLVEVTICTSKGEIIEYYKRQPRSSVHITGGIIPIKITIHRNSKGQCYYLVAAFECLHVVSGINKLSLLKSIHNVDRYTVDDPLCTGLARLRVWCNDDAVPQVFDDSISVVGDKEFESLGSPIERSDNSNIVTSLRVKLTEAKYTIAHNENRYKALLALRHSAVHVMCQELVSNQVDVDSEKHKTEVLTLHNPVPWIKICNRRVILAVTVHNTGNRLLTEIGIILQSYNNSSISYIVKLFEETDSPPYWQQRSSNSLPANNKATLVVTTDVEDFIASNIVRYRGVVLYKLEDKVQFLQFSDVTLTCLEAMNESFDVICSENLGKNEYLSILATTCSLELVFTSIPSILDEDPPDLAKELSVHLKMDLVPGSQDVVRHRSSPYHALSGVMIIVGKRTANLKEFDATVYLRSQSQLLQLIRYIYDALPYRLVITTTRNTLKSAHVPGSMDVDEDVSLCGSEESRALTAYCMSLCDQMSIILKYFDHCMVAMAKSKNLETQALVGTRLDLLVSGQTDYLQFVRTLNSEIIKGNYCLEETLQDKRKDVSDSLR